MKTTLMKMTPENLEGEEKRQKPLVEGEGMKTSAETSIETIPATWMKTTPEHDAGSLQDEVVGSKLG